MQFKELYRSDRYYSVGVDEETGEPTSEVTTTGVAWVDYSLRITAEEFRQFQDNRKALDDLAERRTIDKGGRYYADRLVRTRTVSQWTPFRSTRR